MRKGILSAGNWIIDHVKIIDTYPEKNNLVNILGEHLGTGGCAYNVLINLAKFQSGTPLFGAGVIGDDDNGKFILKDLKEKNINADYIAIEKSTPTSYTDVMTEEHTGERTFFHCRGANAVFGPEHLEKVDTNCKIFHLGYLLLLDKMDKTHPEFGVVAAEVLNNYKEKGYKTSIDVVSEQSDRFKKIILPCLPYIDYLIINETEASGITGIEIRNTEGKIDSNNLKLASKLLINEGVNEIVVIHFPEGGYAITKDMKEYYSPSFLISNDEIKGTVGAGDAFCSAILLGLHEEWDISKILKFGNATARFNLLDPTSTGGAVSLNKVLDFMEKGELRKTLIEI